MTTSNKEIPWVLPWFTRTLGVMALSHDTYYEQAGRPFGTGLRDADLRIVVASTDVRSRQKLKAVIVRRSERGPAPFVPVTAELIVSNDGENIATLQDEAYMLDPHGRLAGLTAGSIADIFLKSAATSETVMITSVSPVDFKRVEAVSRLEQIHISSSPDDRGSWVCRLVDADRLDALFSGRVIDVRETNGA